MSWTQRPLLRCSACGQTWSHLRSRQCPRCGERRVAVRYVVRWGRLFALFLFLALLGGAAWVGRGTIQEWLDEPPPAVGVPPVPAVVRPAPSIPKASPSKEEMAEHHRTLDRLVGEAKYLEAEQYLSSVPSDPRAERIRTYSALLRETQRGGTIPMPEMTRLRLTNGNTLVARTLEKDSSFYVFEDIRGIRSKIARDDVAGTEKLGAHQAFWEVWNELKRVAGYKGIEALEKREESGYTFHFRERPNRKATGLHFFELADFCVSNGANELITPLLDEALQRDRDLVRTVHEIKAERMVGILFYFLSIRAVADAEHTLTQVLIPRYADTRAYRERLSGDAESRQIIAAILQRDVPRENSPPPQEEKPPPEVSTPDDPIGLALSSDVPANVRKLVEEGDRFFRKGTEHLRKSNPNQNSEGWSSENHEALENYRQAASKYADAQEKFQASAEIPRGLLDRFREAQMRMSLCRKRAVSSR